MGCALLLSQVACTDTADPMTDPGGSDSSGSVVASTSSPADSSSSAADGSSGLAESTGGGDTDESSTGAGLDGGVFAIRTFEIPAGATVEEFSFAATTEFNPGLLDGREILVALLDVSHPERNQEELCPGSHPLDGCATVDYGAFGMTHDNRITFEGADGPLSIHLYKDRSLQPEPEPLPANE